MNKCLEQQSARLSEPHSGCGEDELSRVWRQFLSDANELDYYVPPPTTPKLSLTTPSMITLTIAEPVIRPQLKADWSNSVLSPPRRYSSLPAESFPTLQRLRLDCTLQKYSSETKARSAPLPSRPDILQHQQMEFLKDFSSSFAAEKNSVPEEDDEDEQNPLSASSTSSTSSCGSDQADIWSPTHSNTTSLSSLDALEAYISPFDCAAEEDWMHNESPDEDATMTEQNSGDYFSHVHTYGTAL